MGARPLLIVDDDANVREALSRWFGMRGFSVMTAEDGQDGVEKCATGHFDVITLDLEMPRLSGLDAIVPMRKLQPGAAIVVLTGYAQDSQAALSRGAVKVLMKPMRLTKLEEELIDAMQGNGAGATAAQS